MANNILDIKDLTIHYVTVDGTCRAVNNVSLSLEKGETLGLVGETGAGKTTIALGILKLVPNPPGKIIGGEIHFDGEELVGASEEKMREIRGQKISMIFQDPMTALNPIDTVGYQIAEVIQIHNPHLSAAEVRKQAEDMLEMVGIPAARYDEYPHQFSGGMKQRIVIAIALACRPELLIADEPTTALDVTIQAQVLELINQLKRELQTSTILITHDLGVVAMMCSKVAVIYAGQIVESGTAEDIFDRTMHPYTEGLFGSLPDTNANSTRLNPIPGMMPDPMNLPEGCVFAPRCPYATPECSAQAIEATEVAPGHLVRCIHIASRKGADA